MVRDTYQVPLEAVYPPSPINQAVKQVVKGAMQNALFLENEIKQLRAANKSQKRKWDTTRTFIAAGGILTGAEGQQRSQDAADLLAGVDEGGERPSRECVVVDRKKESKNREML